MRILYVTTVGRTMGFFKSLIKDLIDDGNVVDIACGEPEGVPACYREWGCKVYPIDCSRSPLKYGNIRAIKQIRNLVNKEKYDIVHCHTPIAAACTRMACRKARKNGTKVIYTAHGFHFYTGAPLKNWLIYYPIEKICSRWTDVLITINKEDYNRAKKKFNAGKIEYVPGVGIDVKRFADEPTDKIAKRKELSIPEDAFLLMSVGELNRNKNHSVVIRAIAKCNNPSIHYLIAGQGDLYESLKALAVSLGVEKQVHLLGYRNDISSLYKAADVCVFPSIREGQGLAAIEGMASGLPLIVSENRGTRGFVKKENGITCNVNDIDIFTSAIIKMCSDREMAYQMGIRNRNDSKQFDVQIVNRQMKRIYSELIRNY